LKVAGVDTELATRGAQLLRLSRYSPAVNPSEQCWSQIKTFMRRAKVRTVEALIDANQEALATVMVADIRGWFAHCDHPVH